MRYLVFFSLVIFAAVAILFWVFPTWDLVISGWFWDSKLNTFTLAHADWARTIRTAGNVVPWLFAGPAFAALALKLLFPRGRMFMPARAAVFLAFTMAVGPGLLVNSLLKDNWGRPRPVHVEQFAGPSVYTPWYGLDGTCPRNCSFVSGEGALGAWTVAPASLLPPTLQPVGYAAAIAFTAVTGGLRIAFGGHFFSDVIFSQCLVLLLIALSRWFIYARRGAPSSAAIESVLGHVGQALHDAVRLIWRGLAGLVRHFFLPRRGAGL
ncbi:phosphatase PAP2 family protein [Xanthobacteraceae bacterium A53D]